MLQFNSVVKIWYTRRHTSLVFFNILVMRYGRSSRILVDIIVDIITFFKFFYEFDNLNFQNYFWYKFKVKLYASSMSSHVTQMLTDITSGWWWVISIYWSISLKYYRKFSISLRVTDQQSVAKNCAKGQVFDKG